MLTMMPPFDTNIAVWTNTNTIFALLLRCFPVIASKNITQPKIVTYAMVILAFFIIGFVLMRLLSSSSFSTLSLNLLI